MQSVIEIVARSIKDADRTIFNEDYTKQARSVVDGLRKAGYAVVPLDPPQPLIDFAIEKIPFGRLRPVDLIRTMYATMVENARRFVN